ncbi:MULTISPECIES: TRAP transporter small permease subunit [unclassified Lentilitoribacter]|uniref:TRAP transporter small permease subunit n=1 Tax=unclassified Lentilitoribacter TaxID=2647570 RepID=UPI0013A6DE6F|nr:TRAP transporter small permease [Lentilitoribacter sp. Alg239-R112]
MDEKTGGLKEWIYPFAFIFCAGWVIWHGPAYILDFVPHDNESMVAQMTELHQRKDVSPGLSGLFGGLTDIIDWIALLLVPVFFYLGMRSLMLATMEFQQYSRADKFAMFIGRITMILIISMTLIMLYEVLLRYAIEAPTLWANELTLWIAGFVFMLSGIYAMQQRSHIRIFIIYDIMPRWAQHVCDTISVTLLWFFAACLVFGSYNQVFIIKFYRWQTFGTAFDPPIPATIQPMILITVCLISLQALLNLIADWNRDPSEIIEKDVIDEEELEAIKKSVGAS